MSNPSFFTGRFGACACCKKLTAIQEASTGPRTFGAWTASADLVRTIYGSIQAGAASGGEYARVPGTDEQKYRVGSVFTCRRTKYCERHAKKGLFSKRLIWVAIGGALGEMPEALNGPFCTLCWPCYKDSFSHDHGQNTDLTIYIVKTPMDAVEKILEGAPKAPLAPKKAETNTGLDETEGLF